MDHLSGARHARHLPACASSRVAQRGSAWLVEEAASGRGSPFLWSPVPAGSRVQWRPQPPSPHPRAEPSLALSGHRPGTEGLRGAGPGGEEAQRSVEGKNNPSETGAAQDEGDGSSARV